MSKTVIYSRLNLPPRKFSNPGSEVEDLFGYDVDKKTGRKYLARTGEKNNVYQKIQTAAQGCGLYDMINQFQRDGRLDELIASTQDNASAYIDLTVMPKTLAESQAILIRAQNEFDNLPVSARRVFGQDVHEFLASVNDGTFYDRLEKAGIIKAKSPAPEPSPAPAPEPSPAPAPSPQLRS